MDRLNNFRSAESSGVSIWTVFYMYLGAIEKVARRKILGEWRCNNALFQVRCDAVVTAQKRKNVMRWNSAN
jgi:hypothetical protein